MKRTPLERRTPLRPSPLHPGESRLERKVEMKKANPKRRKKERERAYGPAERREWLTSLPCMICGRRPVDQAHAETGGMGRKADADKVVPLCSGPEGHHWEHHRGAETFEAKYGVNLREAAAMYDRHWRTRG